MVWSTDGDGNRVRCWHWGSACAALAPAKPRVDCLPDTLGAGLFEHGLIRITAIAQSGRNGFADGALTIGAELVDQMLGT